MLKIFEFSFYEVLYNLMSGKSQTNQFGMHKYYEVCRSGIGE